MQSFTPYNLQSDTVGQVVSVSPLIECDKGRYHTLKQKHKGECHRTHLSDLIDFCTPSMLTIGQALPEIMYAEYVRRCANA